MTNYFKIYGQKGTGTNYISTILKTNFMNTQVFMNVGGWKHGKIIELPNEVELVNSIDSHIKLKLNVQETIGLFENKHIKFIVMIKNPYMWIMSVAGHKKNLIENKTFVIKQIKIWNLMYSNYKHYIESEKAYLIKYEHLLKDPDSILNDLKTKFNLKRKFLNSYNLETRKLCANTDSNLGKCHKEHFDKEKYINQDINKILSKDIIELINNTIDNKLMNFYNFNFLKNN